MSFINEDDPSLVKEYNKEKEFISTLFTDIKLDNKAIHNYKSMRGIPLNVDDTMQRLYSLNEDVNFTYISSLVKEKDLKMKKEISPVLKKAKIVDFSKFAFDDLEMDDSDEFDDLEDF